MKKILCFQTQNRPSWASSWEDCELELGLKFNLPDPGSLRDYRALTKIHKAASLGKAADVQRRLLLGKNGKNDRDKKNRTLLHYACAHGHPDVVTLLIGWKCDIDVQDSDNSTALIKASQHGHEECMAILLEHGADPNAVDKSGSTALHYTVWSENISMVAKLVAHQARINVKNKDDQTPLFLAVFKHNMEMIQFLASKGAKLRGADTLDRIPSQPGSGTFCETFKKDKSRFNTKSKESAEEPESSVTDVSETPNHGAEDFIPEGQDGNAEDQPIPVAMNQEHNGTAKKTSSEKNKVKDPVHQMFDLKNCRFGLTKAENTVVLDFDTLLEVIYRLRVEYKDCSSLVVIWYGLVLHKRSTENLKRSCEILTEEYEKMKNLNSILKKELSETKDAKSELLIENQELKGQLSTLSLKNSILRDAIKEQGKTTEQHQTNSPIKEEIKKYVAVNESLKRRLEKETKEYHELVKQCDRFKNIYEMQMKDLNMKQSEEENEITILRQKVNDVLAQVKTASLNLENQDNKHKLLCEKLLSMRECKKRCDILEEKGKKLQEEIIALKADIQKNMMKCSEAEKYLREVKERSPNQATETINDARQIVQMQIEALELLQQKKNAAAASLIAEMDRKIAEKKSEVSRLKHEENYYTTELEFYKERYQEIINVKYALLPERDRVSKINQELQKKHDRLVLENELLRPSPRRNFGEIFMIDLNAAENLKQEQNPSVSVSHP